MELTVIVAAVPVAVGALVVLAATTLRALGRGRWNPIGPVARLADELSARLGLLIGRSRRRPVSESRQVPPVATLALALSLAVGLAVVAVIALGVTVLVDGVTDGDGVAMLDHPIARFAAARRSPPLTSVMKVVTNVGGPAGMIVLALAIGLLLGIARRSWAPMLVLVVTAGGIGGITLLAKTAVGRHRPPLAHAAVAAGGFSFPSGHASVAAAVCGAVAWLCGLGMRSWWGRVGLWAAAAMIAALVGISRVYLGVHWMSDVIGGWSFGALWLAVVVGGWVAFSRTGHAACGGRPNS